MQNCIKNKCICSLITVIVITSLVCPDVSWAQDTAILPLQSVFKVNIPRHIGCVSKSWLPEGSLPVVIIQDSHCNYEAQENISGILQFLDSDTGMVAVEGAEGKVDLSLFNSIPDKKIKENISEYYLREGYLSGAEYYSIVHNPGVKLYGVEEHELYFRNLDAFKKSTANKEQLLEHVRRLNDYIRISIPKVFTELQSRYVSLYRNYHSGDLALTRYCHELVKLFGVELFSAFPNIQQVIRCIELEKKIDFKELEKERDMLIKHLENSMVTEDKTRLVQMSLYLRLNRIEPVEYYVYLQKQAAAYACPYDLPNLDIYTELLKLQDGIDINIITEEIEIIESITHKKFFDTKAQKELLNDIISTDILTKLADLRVTRQELDFYLKNKHQQADAFRTGVSHQQADAFRTGVSHQQADALQFYDEIERFYKTAIARDEVLAENFIKLISKSGDKLSVLITGGFHTSGIIEVLRRRNIPYIVISPRITKPHLYETYLKVMFREKDAFEKLLTETGVRLSPILIGANGLSSPLELRIREKEVGILQLSLIVPDVPLVKKLRELKNSPRNEHTERQILTIQNLILKEARRIFEEFIRNYTADKPPDEQKRIRNLFRLAPLIEVDEAGIRFSIEVEDRSLAVSVGKEGKGKRIGSYTVNIQGEKMEFLPKPQFPLREGKGMLPAEASRYIEGPNGKGFLERVFQAKEFSRLTGGIEYVESLCLTEANIEKMVCEVNEKIVAIISFLLTNRLITEDSAREFYRFLFHHEQAHAVLNGRGYAHEFIIHLGDYFRLTRDEADKIRIVLNAIREQKGYLEYTLGIDILDYKDINNVIDLLDAYSIILDSTDTKEGLNDSFQLFLGTLIGHLDRFHPEVSVYQDIKELIGIIRTQFTDFLLEYISRGSIEYQRLSIFVSLFEFMRVEAAKKYIAVHSADIRNMDVEDKVVWASGVLNEFHITDQSLRLSIVKETMLTKGKYANLLSKLSIGFPITQEEVISKLEGNKELFKAYTSRDVGILIVIMNSIFNMSLDAKAIADRVLPRPEPVEIEAPPVREKPPPEIPEPEEAAEKPSPARRMQWLDSLAQDLAAIITKEVDNWDNPPPVEVICERVMKSIYLLTHPRLKDIGRAEIEQKIRDIVEGKLAPYKDPIEEKIRGLRHYNLFSLGTVGRMEDDVATIRSFSNEFVETVRDLGKINVYQLDKEEKEIIQEYSKRIYSSGFSEAKEYAKQLVSYIRLRNTTNRYVYFQFLFYIEVEHSTQTFEESAGITEIFDEVLKSLYAHRVFIALIHFQRYAELCRDPSLAESRPYIIRDFTNLLSNQSYLHKIADLIAKSGNTKLKTLFTNIVLGGKEVKFVRFLYLMPLLEEMELSEESRKLALLEFQSLGAEFNPQELRQFQIDLANLIKSYKTLPPSQQIYQKACFLEEIAKKTLPGFSRIYKEETSSVSELKRFVESMAIESIRSFILRNPSASELKAEMDKGPEYRNAYLRYLVGTPKDSSPELIETIVGCMRSPYEITAFLHSWDFNNLEGYVKDALSQKLGGFANDPRLAKQIDDIMSRSFFQFQSNRDFYKYTAGRVDYSFRHYLIDRILNAESPLAYYCLLVYSGYLSGLEKEDRIQELKDLIKRFIEQKGYNDIVLLDIIFIASVRDLQTDEQSQIVGYLIEAVKEKFHAEKARKIDDINHFRLWLRHFIESVNCKNKSVVIDLSILAPIDSLILEAKPAESCEDIINKYKDLNGPFDIAKSKEFIEGNRERIINALREMGGIDIYKLNREEKDTIIRALNRIFSASSVEDAKSFADELKSYITAENTENRYLYMLVNIDSRIWPSRISVSDCMALKMELLKTCNLLDKYIADPGVGFIQRILDIQRFMEALGDPDLIQDQKICAWHLIFPKIQTLLTNCREFHSIVTLSGNSKLIYMFSDQLTVVSCKETGDFLVWYFLHKMLDLVPEDKMKKWKGLKRGMTVEVTTDAAVLLREFEKMAVLFKIYPEEVKFQLTAALSAIKTIEREYDPDSPQCRLIVPIRKFLDGCFSRNLLKELNKRASAHPYLTGLNIEDFKKELESLNSGNIDEDSLFNRYSSSPMHRIFLIYQYALLSSALDDKGILSRLKPIAERIIQEISSPYEISALFVLAVPHVLPDDIYRAIIKRLSQFLSQPDMQDEIFHGILFRGFDNYIVHSALILIAMEKGKDFKPLINFIAEGSVTDHVCSIQALFNFLSQRKNAGLLKDTWKTLIERNGLIPLFRTQYFFTAPLLHLMLLKDYQVEFIDLWRPVEDFYNRKLIEGNYQHLNILAFAKMIQGVILQYYPSPPPGYEPEKIQAMAEELIRRNMARLAEIAIARINEYKDTPSPLPLPRGTHAGRGSERACEARVRGMQRAYAEEVMDYLGIFEESVREDILGKTGLTEEPPKDEPQKKEPPATPDKPPRPPKEPPKQSGRDDLSSFLSRDDLADRLKDPGHIWKQNEFEIDTDESGVAFIPYRYKGQQRIAFIQTREYESSIIIRPQFHKEDLFSEAQWVFSVRDRRDNPMFGITIEPPALHTGLNPFYCIEEVSNQLIIDWIEGNIPKPKPFLKNVIVTRDKKDGAPCNAGFDLCHRFRKKHRIRIIRGILRYIKNVYQKAEGDEEKFKEMSQVLVKPQEIDPLNKYVEVYGKNGDFIGRYWLVKDGEIKTDALSEISASEEKAIREKLSRFHSYLPRKREIVVGGVRRRLPPEHHRKHKKIFERQEHEYNVDYLFSWSQIQELVDFYAQGRTPVRRLFLDLDEVILRPKGLIASDTWMAQMVSEHGYYRAKKDWRSHEERMINARFFEFVEPEIRDIIQRLRSSYGIDIVIVTARAEEDYERTKSILATLDLEVDRDAHLVCAGGGGIHKVRAIQQYIETSGDIKKGEINLFIDDKPYSVAIVRDKGKGLSAGEIFSYCYANPKDYESITVEEYLSLAQEAEERGNLEGAEEYYLNAQEYYLNLLEYSQKVSAEQRLEIYRNLSAKIEELQKKGIDVTALLVSFLPKATGFIKDIEDQDTAVSNKPQFEEFLFRWFKFYFKNYRTFCDTYKYWQKERLSINEALKKIVPIIKPTALNQGRFQEYEIEINEDNSYLFLEPTLEYIARERPDVIFVIDTGGRPFFEPVKHFITRCGFPTKVALIPVSYKNTGDTEFEVNRFLQTENIAEIFPLADKRVLIIDDNVVSGGTIQIMENVLTKYGISALATATPMRFNSDKLDHEVVSTFNTYGSYLWKKDRPSVAAIPCWDQDDRRYLRGVKQGRRFGGFMREPLTGDELQKAKEFHARLLSNFRQALRIFGQPLIETARKSATLQPEMHHDMSDEGIMDILIGGRERIMELLTSAAVNTLFAVNRLLEVAENLKELLDANIFVAPQVIRKILLELDIYPAQELIDFIRTKLLDELAKKDKSMKQTVSDFWCGIEKRRDDIRTGTSLDFNSPLDRAIYFKNTFMKYEQYLNIINLYLKAPHPSLSPQGRGTQEDFGKIDFEVSGFRIKLVPARRLEDFLNNYTVMEDPYGDQLFYPDFINYNIVIDGAAVGRMSLLNLTDENNPSARILYFKNLQIYENFPKSLDIKVFVDSILEKVKELHDSHNYSFMLIPPAADIYQFSRNQEVRRYFEDRYRWGATTSSILSLAEVSRLLNLNMQDRNRYYKSIKSRLEILRPDFMHWRNALYQSAAKFLVPGFSDKPVAMLTSGQLKPLSDGFIRLLNWRFEATKEGYPPVIIHKKLTDRDRQAISEWEKEEKLLAKVLFDENEKRIFDSICQIKRLNEELHPGQERFYKRLWDRIKVGRIDTEELMDWQIIVMRDIMVNEIPSGEPYNSERFNFNAFLRDPSSHIENWAPEQRSRWLRYQAIEVYEDMRFLKQQGQLTQTPTWFYEGEDGRERGMYLAQYVVKEILKGKDITELRRRDFVENGLALLWDRVFHRDIFQIAEAVYPGQFQQDDKGNLLPNALTLNEIKQFIEGTLELAVGRRYVGENLGVHQLAGANFVRVENDRNQGIVLNVYKKQGEELVLLATYKKRELKNGAEKINLAISDIIDYCSGKENILPGKETVLWVGPGGNIEITGDIILKDTGINPGEEAVLRLEEDINHGTILNIYRKGDSKPASQYLYIKSITKIDISMHDLFNYFYGIRKIELRQGVRIEISQKVSGTGKLELAYLDWTIRLNIPSLKDKTALIKLENDENEGLVLNIYDYEEFNTLPGNLVYPKRSYLFKQIGLPSQETDLRLKSIIYFVYGIQNIFGYETTPKTYFSAEPVPKPEQGSLASFNIKFADKTLSFNVPGHLIGRRIAIVPQRHYQHGYIFEIHALEEYLGNPYRTHDICLMRDRENNTLVPYKGPVVSMGEQKKWVEETRRVLELYGDFLTDDEGNINFEQLFGLILGRFPRTGRESLQHLVRTLRGHVSRIRPTTHRRKPKPKEDIVPEETAAAITVDEADLIREFTEILINNNYKRIKVLYEEDENKAKQYILSIFDESMASDEICRMAMIRAKRILIDAIDFNIRGIIPSELRRIELYQRINLIYLLDRDSLYFSPEAQRYPNKILADDPGLGKTLETILFILNAPVEKTNGPLRVALVVPNASKEQELWRDELNKWVIQKSPMEIRTTPFGAVYMKIPQAGQDGRDIEIILYNYEALRVTLVHSFDVYSKYLRVSQPAVEEADLEKENELIEQFFRDLQRLDPSLSGEIKNKASQMYWKKHDREHYPLPTIYFQKQLIRALNKRLRIYNQAAKEVKGMCENLLQKAGIDWINEPEKVKEILWEKIKERINNICQAEKIREDEETKWIDEYLQRAFFMAVKRRYERLNHVQGFNPDILIIDESHTIRTETTLTTLSIRAINAARKLYLTATPLVGRDSRKLFTQLNSLYPDIFTKEEFNREFPNNPQGISRLSKALIRFMVRREAKDVTDLPPVEVIKDRVELEGIEREVSDITEEVIDEYFAAMSSTSLTPDEIHNRMLRAQQASCGLFVLSEYIAQLKLMKAVQDELRSELKYVPMDRLRAVMDRNMPDTDNPEQLRERTIKEIGLRRGQTPSAFKLLNPKEERLLELAGKIPDDYIPAKMKRFVEIAEEVLGRVHITSPDRKTVLATLHGKRLSRPPQWCFSLYTKDGRHVQDFEVRTEKNAGGIITGLNFQPVVLPENIAPGAIDMQKADLRSKGDWDVKIKGEKKKNDGLFYDMQNLQARLHDGSTFEPEIGYRLTTFNGKLDLPLRFSQDRRGFAQIKIDPELVSMYGLQREDICIFPKFYPINGVLVPKGNYGDIEMQEDTFIPVTHKEIDINGVTYPIVFEKLAVLSRFVSVARKTREIFGHHGVSYVAEDVSDRLGELNKFRVDPSVPVYIGTTDQNYQALSLVTNRDFLPHHVARTMVLYDLHWQPLDQISLRMRRQGQYWPVKIHILMGNSADESRFFDVSEKREVQQLIVGGRLSLEGKRQVQEKTFIALKILFARTKNLLRMLKKETFSLLGRDPTELKVRFNNIAQEQIDVLENTPMFTQSIAMHLLCLPLLGRYLPNPKPNFGFDSRLPLKERMALKKLRVPYKGESKLDIEKDVQISDLDFMFQTLVRKEPDTPEEASIIKSPLRDKSLDIVFSETLNSIPARFIPQVLAEYERVLNNHGILALSLSGEYEGVIAKILTEEYGFELISTPGQRLVFNEDIISAITDSDPELIERLRSDIDENLRVVVLRKTKDKQRDLMGVKTDSLGVPLPAEYQRYIDELARIFDIYAPIIGRIQTKREIFPLPKPYPVDLRELSYDGVRLLPRREPEPVETLKPGSPQMARRLIEKYFKDGRGFTLRDYMNRLVRDGYRISDTTARSDLEKLEEVGLLYVEKGAKPYTYFYLAGERNGYRMLARRVIPLLLGKIDIGQLTGVLPKEGARQWSAENLLEIVNGDSTGCIAGQLLDAVLSNNTNIPQGIVLSGDEAEIIRVEIQRLHREKLNDYTNEVIDEIIRRFGADLGEIIIRTYLARLLDRIGAQLETNYILIDIDRLDPERYKDIDKIIEKLNQMRKDPERKVRIIWSSHRTGSDKGIEDFVKDLMSANDLIVSNPERLTPEQFVRKLKDTLRRENIPIQELSILTTQENYPIYMGLEIVKRSFERTEIPLSAGEYEQLKPFLPEDIDRYITYSDGRYILQFAPLSDDRMELLELIRQAQKKLAYMA